MTFRLWKLSKGGKYSREETICKNTRNLDFSQVENKTQILRAGEFEIVVHLLLLALFELANLYGKKFRQNASLCRRLGGNGNDI